MEIAEKPLNVLHLEDSDLDHALAERFLASGKTRFKLHRVDSLDDFLAQAISQKYDAILADYRLAGFTALDAWQALKPLNLDIPFVILSGAIGEKAAVEAIQMGISDYVRKDDLSPLSRTILRAIEVQRINTEKRRAVAALAASQQQLADFSEHLQTTIEEERSSIAREIHDDIGGSLAAIKLDLAWLERHAVEEKTLEHIATAKEMLQLAIDSSQQIMRNLRPAILDQGLLAAVQWLSTSFRKRTGIPVKLVSRPLGEDIPKEIQLTAYRTAQEALTNISKHAQCTQVVIDISDARGVLTVEISDNGKGIEKEKSGKSGGFGLLGLKERAKALGGWMDVSTRSGAGTSIILTIPLQPGFADSLITRIPDDQRDSL